MAATLDAGRRGRDVIVADLPRQLDDAAVLALQAADRALLIVPAELRATAAAARVARTVRVHCDDVAVVVRGPAPGRLRPREVARGAGAAAGRLAAAGAGDVPGARARARRRPRDGQGAAGRAVPAADRGADGEQAGGGA